MAENRAGWIHWTCPRPVSLWSLHTARSGAHSTDALGHEREKDNWFDGSLGFRRGCNPAS